MIEREFPILEFDEDRNAFIKPAHVHSLKDIAERCVLCFFSEAIEKILSECAHRIVAHIKAESVKLPVHESKNVDDGRGLQRNPRENPSADKRGLLDS